MSKTPQARIATNEEKHETLQIVKAIHIMMKTNGIHRQSAANACMFAAAQIITAEEGVRPEDDDAAAQAFKTMLQQARIGFLAYKRAQN